MRILSAHISGFGCFYDKKFDLSQDIVQIKQDNGWGKTTFVDFLECMFYGMDESRKRAVEENFRVKYRPFQGGVFGGTLTFLYQNTTYRVERVFGEKPSQDMSKVYDTNNFPTALFGERAERLGETLFGVDRESYRRSVYLPQGEIPTGAFTDDIKGKLTALLSSNGQTDGETDAVAILEKAERELRSKRAPYKGKLDEIDARLSQLTTLRAEAARAAELSASYTQKEKQAVADLRCAEEKYAQTETLLSEYERRKERAANRLAYEQLQNRVTQAESRLAALNEFFGQTTPETVNVTGIRAAIDEYYSLKAEEEHLQSRWAELQTLTVEKERALSELAACEKTVDTFSMLSQAQSKAKGEDAREKKEGKKRKGKRMGYALIAICLFLGALLIGISQVKVDPALGWGFMGVGGLGLLISMRVFWKNAFSHTPKTTDAFADKTLNEEYQRAKAEHAAAQEKYQRLCEREKEFTPLKDERTGQTERLQALDKAIQAFLQNFAFAQTYDYRAALCTLQENVENHAALTKEVVSARSQLAAFGEEPTQTESISEDEYLALKRKKATLESDKRSASESKAYYAAKREEAQLQAAKDGAYHAEEAECTAEKARLEKRLFAVQTAKELIIRARHNLAARYLTPVEEGCKRYVLAMGIDKSVRFSADGMPYAEERGILKETDYYSKGLRGLWDFCIRLALADCMFTGEKPLLVLDDPFTDLDDRKTELGKKLLKTLSKDRQIVYCTCKQERML
jgi:DNA repair exonuclease SbcCD ATPase subunit